MREDEAKAETYCPYCNHYPDTFCGVPIDDAVKIILKHKPEEPEPPKYKLFEISWDEGRRYPEINGSVAQCGVRVEYVHSEYYRIFGFTDNPNWATIAMAMEAEGGSPHYKTEPCDHTGTRKYAIGRYEA